MSTKTMTLSDFLTSAQIKEVIKLKTMQAIKDKIILPNIEEINRKLGQENDPTYLAYACEYVVSRSIK